MLKPQIRESLGSALGTCAIGAAADAIGRLNDHAFRNGWAALYQQWPTLAMITHPPGGTSLAGYRIGRAAMRWEVSSIIIALNDTDGWTREQIADWVATIEPAEQCSESERTSVSHAADPVDASAALHVVRD